VKVILHLQKKEILEALRGCTCGYSRNIFPVSRRSIMITSGKSVLGSRWINNLKVGIKETEFHDV
jgi:hypothetical protein